MLTRESRVLHTVNELTRLITSTLYPRDVLYRIVNKIAEIMPVTRCSVLRIDWAGQAAYVVASFETPHIDTIKLSLKKYPEIVEALVKKKPVFIRNILKDPLMASVKDMISPLGVRCILVVPIIFKEKVIGTLFLRTSRARHSFTEKDMKLLKTLSDASANSLYNAFRFARIDDVTSRWPNPRRRQIFLESMTHLAMEDIQSATQCLAGLGSDADEDWRMQRLIPVYIAQFRHGLRASLADVIDYLAQALLVAELATSRRNMVQILVLQAMALQAV